MTQTFSPKVVNFGTVALCALAATMMALLVATALNWQELQLCDRLRLLLAVQPNAVGSVVANPAVIYSNFAVTVLVSTVACLAGGLAAIPRLICWLQIFVLSLVLQWFLLSASMQPRPIAFFCGIIFGGSFGYLLRLRRLAESKKQSQYMELVLRNRELQEARLQMVKQDEVDRRLLAADLHDQVLNDLKILNQKFMAFRIEPSDDNASAIDTLLHQAMNGVRDVMDSLSPAVLEHLGFAPALEDCLRRASERSSGFKVRFKNLSDPDDVSGLSLIEQTLLYRLVQECGTNICKHAQATTVKLTLEIVDKDLLIRITDNGRGMPDGMDASASRGLRYMRQRGDLIGATIAWLPGEKSKGTTVEIRMPVKKQT